MQPDYRTTSNARAFSLIELVIVIVILAIISAIAIPRIGSASQNAGEAALRADLKTIRQAIDLYAAEHHGDWPGLRDAGSGIGPQTSQAIEAQLTLFTADRGEVSMTRDSAHGYGPYLQKIPPLPVGKNAGQRAIASTNHFSTPGAPGTNFGWEFEHYFGRFRANCPESEVGANGVPYCEW